MGIKNKAFAALSIVLLLGSSLGLINVAAAEEEKSEEVKSHGVTFTDVPKNHYSFDAIMYLADNDIISGYGNGEFGFRNNVTRGQVAALISRYLKLDTSQVTTNPYTDVKGTMFENEILAVTEYGYMGGIGENIFGPDGVLTREEMAVVLTRLFNLRVKTTDLFWDMKKGHWSSESVQALYSNGITFGSGDNTYIPTGKVTREQYAEFLYRSINLDKNYVAKPIPVNPAEKPNPEKPEPKPEPEPTPPDIYVNGEKVDYPVKPIIRNGATLVPIRETFEAMGVEVVWNQEEGSVYATKGNQDIKLQIGSNRAWINNKEIDLQEAPIVYEGKTIIPLRFVGEAFNGKVYYDNDVNEIYIIMPEITSDFLEKEQSLISNIQDASNIQIVGNRRLMLSDNPETLDLNTIKENNATLWNDVISENKESIEHRVFGWHTNQFDSDITVGITIENLSETNTIELMELKGVHKISARNYRYEVGLPVAKAVLNDQLSEKFINSDSQDIVLDSFTLKPRDMLGFLNDFTVIKSSGTGELNYIIRTVVTLDNSILTDIKSIPVPLDFIRRHPRGVWSGSEIMTTFPVYDVGEGSEKSYNISNGLTDNLFNESTSLVKNAESLANRGHFGAVYTVKIPYVNKTNEDKKIRIRVGSRGGVYTGVVKTENGVLNIPTLNPMIDVVNVLERKVTDEKGFIELKFMHAGGSDLPIAISIDILE